LDSRQLRSMSSSRAAWGDLLSAAAAKDLSAALQAVLRGLEAEAVDWPTKGGRKEGLASLAQALASALQQSLQGNPSRLLLANSALLAALDFGLPPGADASLASDAVLRGVSGALTSRWPLASAAAVRCVCSLAVAIHSQPGSREDRQEKQTWLRKVVPQLRAALEAHPRALQVQEAFVEGCCTLLMSEQTQLGGNAGVLWSLLWPLAVHPRHNVAQGAGLCLCRLTWRASGAKSAGEGHHHSAGQQLQVPSAEAAIRIACVEFGQVFQALLPSGRFDATAVATPAAQVQCCRLLGLLQDLVLYSRSSTLQVPGSRRERKGVAVALDDANVVLPLAKILGAVDLVLVALFRNTTLASSALAEVWGSARGLASVLTAALELVAALVDVAGVAILVHAGQIRRWLEQLTELRPDTHWRHVGASCALVLTLAQRVPAVLLRERLLARLCNYALAAMRPATAAAVAAAAPAPAGGKPRKRKGGGDKAAAAAGDDGEAPGRNPTLTFRPACQMLARLVAIGSPMLRPQLVASICEQVVQMLWLGLLQMPTAAAAGGPEAAAAALEAAACEHICRDSASVLSLLDLVEALHQPPRLGVTPLAPSLVSAFAALLEAVRDTFQRRAVDVSSRDGGLASVQLRVNQVSDALLVAAGRLPIASSTTSTSSGAGLSISWPQALSGQALAPAAATSAWDVVEEEADEEEEEEVVEEVSSQLPDTAEAPGAHEGQGFGTKRPLEESEQIKDDSSAKKQRQEEVVEAKKSTEEEATQLQADKEATGSQVEAVAQPGVEKKEQPEVAKEELRRIPEMHTAAAAVALPEARAPAVSSARPEPPSVPEADVALGLDGTMELFPDEGDTGSPLPELCMDSPSDDDN